MGLSRKAKSVWSDDCQAYWPCIRCSRDYTAVCPHGWIRMEQGLSCSSPSSYTGPCQGTTDFTGFNADMLRRWSSDCGAFWKCREHAEDLNPIPSAYPITKVAAIASDAFRIVPNAES